MKRILLIVLIVSSLTAAGQETSCVQTLRLAQTTYEQGRLHELPALLGPCLKSGFTDEEKRQAYLLLTMSYIYLEEPEEADNAMLKLLQTDHFFKPDENVHPAEFISLYGKFRTKSLFRIGANLGPIFNLASVYGDDYVGQTSSGSGKYAPRVGFQIAAVFEKDILERGKTKFPVLTLAPEIAYALRGYSYSGTPFEKYDPEIDPDAEQEPAAKQEYTAKIARFEINPLVKWNVKETNFNPYIIAGPGLNYLVKNTISGAQLNWLNGAGTVTGADIPDYVDTGKVITLSGILGIGVRYRLGGVFASLDIRYRADISNFIKANQRNIAASQFDYAIASDNFRLTAFSINLGIHYAYFNPKKLIK